jgi:hypothetical protein
MARIKPTPHANPHQLEPIFINMPYLNLFDKENGNKITVVKNDITYFRTIDLDKKSVSIVL